MTKIEIVLSEEDKKILDDYFSVLNKLKQFQMEVSHSSSITEKQRQEQIQLFNSERRLRTIAHQKCGKLFLEKILPFLNENPGFVQVDLKTFFPELYRDGLYSTISSFLWCLSELNLVKREKKGRSYGLFIIGDLEKIKNFISEPDNMFQAREQQHGTIVTQAEIPAIRYENWKQMIINFFGEKTINRLFSSIWKSNLDFFSSEPFYKELKPEGKAEFINYRRIDIFERLLTDLGGGFKFEVNDKLQQIIDKYWSTDFENKIGSLNSSSDFMVDNFQSLAKDILGRENFRNFIYELGKNTSEFKIKWCGCWDSLRVNYFPKFYIQSIAYKKSPQSELREPDLSIKICKYCGKKFDPYYYFIHVFSKKAVMNIYTHIKSINEIDFCPRHALPQYEFRDESENKMKPSKNQMLQSLKKLYDLIGVIPPSNFHSDLSYLKGLDKDKFDEAIKVLNSIPPYEKKSDFVPYDYKEVFGSWFKTLIAAGVLEGEARKMPRGYMCLALDGHECLSLGEKTIDDWLYRHSISHEKEPKYPGEYNFRGDWKVDNYFIEYWGLAGQEDYDNKILLKREIAKEYNISLVEISPEDLNNLNETLKILLEKKDHLRRKNDL